VLSARPRDSQLAVDFLRAAGIDAQACDKAAALFAAMATWHLGAVVAAEEAFDQSALDELKRVLPRQPKWSDLPVILFTTGSGCSIDKLLVSLGGNVTALERPVRYVLEYAHVRTALRARRRQYELRDVLDKDTELKARLEEIRLEAGRLMGLGDVSSKVVPKMALVAPPAAGGHVCTRSFIPHECHASIGVFAAVTVATACVLPGSPAARVAKIPPGREKTLSVEHPTGEFSVVIEVGGTEDSPVVEKAGLLRTARLLFEGHAFAHEALAEALDAGRDAA